MDDEELTTVVAQEQQLLDPACRASEDRLRDLLHPDFLEYGASGTVWTFDGVVARLPASPTLDGTGEGFTAHRLADGVVLVTFRLLSEHHTSLRSSVWVRCEDGRWRLRFHQGTRAAAAE
ncbi:DUF4440 domain-containing protein [Nocardioides sp.]|uniref:nuclear transport factor 2 family protein n=1 Tax=Nocardioides sp. TaxID=35761 RepID=UPI003516DA54